MENPGCVTVNENLIYKNMSVEDEGRFIQTLVHELVHMWFGNLVTMKWWDDLWLNESFADFMALYCLIHYIHNRVRVELEDYRILLNIRKEWGYKEDQLKSTHPVICSVMDTEQAKSNFDGITYAKGCSSLYQLIHIIGETSF